MWSVALYQLGISEGAFWRMTPRHYSALLAQHKARIRHDELLAAIVASAIVNTSMAAPDEPAPFAAFMPCEWAAKAARKPRARRVSKGERDFINSKIHCFLAARAAPAK